MCESRGGNVSAVSEWGDRRTDGNVGFRCSPAGRPWMTTLARIGCETATTVRQIFSSIEGKARRGWWWRLC